MLLRERKTKSENSRDPFAVVSSPPFPYFLRVFTTADFIIDRIRVRYHFRLQHALTFPLQNSVQLLSEQWNWEIQL